ncbi:unnamed protein product [Macrosiphum euphorbiae]|uniref:Uncharacterized protein n=1 Tax=Macrosiphum euphorbiae TaxID=13131 RepID=A0AAV0Y8F6_9HEMI|nr:unnamed protein product [Macrosiphum euphorbiae]
MKREVFGASFRPSYQVRKNRARPGSSNAPTPSVRPGSKQDVSLCSPDLILCISSVRIVKFTSDSFAFQSKKITRRSSRQEFDTFKFQFGVR